MPLGRLWMGVAAIHVCTLIQTSLHTAWYLNKSGRWILLSHGISLWGIVRVSPVSILWEYRKQKKTKLPHRRIHANMCKHKRISNTKEHTQLWEREKKHASFKHSNKVACKHQKGQKLQPLHYTFGWIAPAVTFRVMGQSEEVHTRGPGPRSKNSNA